MARTLAIPTFRSTLNFDTIRERPSRLAQKPFKSAKRRSYRVEGFPLYDGGSDQAIFSVIGVSCAALAMMQHQKANLGAGVETNKPKVSLKDSVKAVISSAKELDLDWGGCESSGPRAEMEDCWCMHRLTAENMLYFGVFDGHGGSASSAFLKENLLSFTSAAGTFLCRSVIGEGISEYGVIDENPLALAFEQADCHLLDHLSTLGDPDCWSGSTATVVFLSSSHILTANVGDSRAVLGRKNRTIDLSNDHRPVSSTKAGRSEINRIAACGGWISQMRVCGILAVTRAFGDYEFKGGRSELLEDLRVVGIPKSGTLVRPPVVAVPDVSVIERTVDDDFLIIATDGLWDVTNSVQAITFVRSIVKKNPNCSMDEIARSLIDRAIRSRTGDNVSCIVIDLRTA